MKQREPAREPVDTTTEIETPEHVRFRYHVAGPANRALAYLVDLAARGLVLTVFIFLAALGGLSAGEATKQASNGVLLLAFFVIEWGYYVFFETISSGRTPGKRVFGLRVVTEGGHPLRFGDSLLRNLLRAADFLPGAYAIGLLVMGRDARFRRLGDLAAGTIVITEARHAVTAKLRLDPPPTAAELRGLPQRLPLSGEELDAVDLFLRRVGRLAPSREEELAEMVAPLFARRMGARYKSATRFLGLLHYRAREQHEKKSG
jgi:uncharacterized RDD family membrane protein YckC